MSTEMIRDRCYLDYYCNSTSIKPAVFDGSYEFLLVYWSNKKSLEYANDNDISVKISDYSYVLVNKKYSL